MMKKLLALGSFLMLSANLAQADLSSNPWLEQNDEEDIREVYTKRQKRANLKNGVKSYTPEAETVIDRSHAYIELPEQKEDSSKGGFLDKILGSSEEESSGSLIPNTEDNRRLLSHKPKAPATDSAVNDGGKSFMSGLGIDKSINKLKNAVKLPSGTGLIQKFERASGIDLKAIGRQMRR